MRRNNLRGRNEIFFCVDVCCFYDKWWYLGGLLVHKLVLGICIPDLESVRHGWGG